MIGGVMEEIISSVLQAEQRAEDIIKSAAEKAKVIREQGDKEAENIKNSAVAVAKLSRAKKLREAEKAASAEYDKIMGEQQEHISLLSAAARKNMQKAAELLAERVLKQWQ